MQSFAQFLCMFPVNMLSSIYSCCKMRMKDSPIAREEAQQMEMVTYAGDEWNQGKIKHHLHVLEKGTYHDIALILLLTQDKTLSLW